MKNKFIQHFGAQGSKENTYAHQRISPFLLTVEQLPKTINP